ncbi:MAG: P1 family peptidase [Syntrophomonadaceae bacterium]|nr:P1 family peptidase [Syntrophomonadaceae bacterium]MDD3888908.1 P1 family peptidase [Syntrophomonadaceae bacterium]MDD4548920.1 P1 family peptidase [Syntrophomonadaceae bacterium]
MANSITDVKGIEVGSVEDLNALTGCTVILTGTEGAVCGVDVRGGGPGTRETDLLSPLTAIEKVHAILLSGGSAYGLDAAGGVMNFLEEHGTGHPVGFTVVPIVPAAILFDLGVGDWRVRPDRQMGYLACQKAGVQVREGNVGAGAGATVGKIKGVKYGTKSGLGSWSITLESGLTIGAIAAVNALGDVIDPDQGKIIAGVRGKEGFLGTPQVWEQEKNGILNPRAGTNTTIAVVASNARLDKAGATKVAQMAQNGLVKVINPVHTMFDGDTVFALATGELTADINLVGYLAAEVLSQAILRAVYKAETIQGIKCWKD